MNRQKINKQADNWVMADTDNRSMFFCSAEMVNNEPKLSFSVGGSEKLLFSSLLAAMDIEPGLASLMYDVVDTYRKYKANEQTSKCDA